MVPIPVGLLVGSFAAGLLLAAGVIRLALHLQWVAVPNERSSHRRSTPTAGGVAIVVPVLCLLGVQAAGGDAVASVLILCAGGLALLGLIDDVRPLSAGLRFACQMLAAAVLVWYLTPDLNGALKLVITFLVVWHVNLFNFMDGIDGIAAVQTLVFCLGVPLVAGGVDGLPGLLIWVTAGATLGFLAFNWPPARLFMGDVGALFLGLLIAALVLLLDAGGTLGVVPSLVLLTGFWFDASYTLCVRMMTGQPFTRPHRSHLYQRLTDRLGHRRTTMLFGAMGFFWLLPLAWLAERQVGWEPVLLGVAALPYLAGALAFGAGRALDVRS
jgi:Fuc2NAc and GlcNAc transferase